MVSGGGVVMVMVVVVVMVVLGSRDGDGRRCHIRSVANLE